MWWIWIPVAILVLLATPFLVMWLIGRRLPVNHVCSAAIDLAQPPEVVWDLIADVNQYPSWSRINKVVRLEDREGQETWRQHFGRNSVVTRTTRSQRPLLLEQTIADDAKFFSGRWLYELTPTEAGTTLTLTEHGQIHMAIPRFMMHYLVDPAQYLKGQLRSIADKFNQPASIRILISSRRGNAAAKNEDAQAPSVP